MKSLSASSDVSAARERLAADFSSLVAHAEELIHATSSLSSEGVDVARQKLTQSIQQMKEQIAPARDYALERTRAAVDQAVGYARQNPWRTAAALVLVGLFVSFLSSSGRRS